jgi:Fur family transcriptional regulator, peroxide stress response regulator
MASSKKKILEKLAAFESACRKAGLRLTHQRLEVYRELAIADDHPTAEILYQRLRRNMPTISLDTVYRTLATFESHGLIGKVDTVESQARFEATGIRHHHIICRKCREIMDFQWRQIDDAALPDEISQWGRIDNRNVVVYGVCGSCLEKG